VLVGDDCRANENDIVDVQDRIESSKSRRRRSTQVFDSAAILEEIQDPSASNNGNHERTMMLSPSTSAVTCTTMKNRSNKNDETRKIIRLDVDEISV
jgi:hypothetical protein